MALLYPGDMGGSIGRACLAAGLRVVTTVAGRSQATVERATPFEVLPSLDDVVRAADVILSVVHPLAAYEVAEQVARSAQRTGRADAIVYVDTNALRREEVERIDAVCTSGGFSCVDACILGSARRIETCTFYCAGPRAGEVAQQLTGVMSTRVLGTKVGDASSFKLDFSALVKGIFALFFEIGAAARTEGHLDDLLEAYGSLDFDVLLSEASLTYITHAHRRSEELRLAADSMRRRGVEPRTVLAAADTLRAIGRFDMDELHRRARSPSVDELLARVARAIARSDES